MKKPFIIEIDRIQSIDSIFLSQGDYSGVLEQYLENYNFNIYFITYVDKFRFDLDNCRIDKNLFIVKFIGKQDEYILPNYTVKKFDKDKSTSRSITLTIIDDTLVRFTLNDFITKYCLKISRIQEIIYIGQSINIVNRLENHEKLIRAFASLPDNKEVLINFIEPSFGYFNNENNELVHFNKETIMHTNFKAFRYDELINLTERILVKFFKPVLNTNFINTNFSTDKIISKRRNLRTIFTNQKVFNFNTQ